MLLKAFRDEDDGYGWQWVDSAIAHRGDIILICFAAQNARSSWSLFRLVVIQHRKLSLPPRGQQPPDFLDKRTKERITCLPPGNLTPHCLNRFDLRTEGLFVRPLQGLPRLFRSQLLSACSERMRLNQPFG